jgi:hypothetical protein
MYAFSYTVHSYTAEAIRHSHRRNVSVLTAKLIVLPRLMDGQPLECVPYDKDLGCDCTVG